MQMDTTAMQRGLYSKKFPYTRKKMWSGCYVKNLTKNPKNQNFLSNKLSSKYQIHVPRDYVTNLFHIFFPFFFSSLYF